MHERRLCPWRLPLKPFGSPLPPHKPRVCAIDRHVIQLLKRSSLSVPFCRRRRVGRCFTTSIVTGSECWVTRRCGCGERDYRGAFAAAWGGLAERQVKKGLRRLIAAATQPPAADAPSPAGHRRGPARRHLTASRDEVRAPVGWPAQAPRRAYCRPRTCTRAQKSALHTSHPSAGHCRRGQRFSGPSPRSAGVPSSTVPS